MHSTFTICVAIMLLLVTPTATFARSAGSPEETKLSFIENKGQITDQNFNTRNDIDFKLETRALNVFVGNGKLHYQWSRLENAEEFARDSDKDQQTGIKAQYTLYRMDVELVGANINAPVTATDKMHGYDVFYTSTAKNVMAYSYQRITYKNVYPNIDWVLLTSDNKVKHEFVVHPGGNPADIKLKYSGHTQLELRGGALFAGTPFGSVTEEKPYSYEASTGRTVSSGFVQNGDLISFITGSYNGTLIIDPTFTWATYYGGSGEENGGDVATDDAGNVYLGGDTKSPNNIASTGAPQTSIGLKRDSWVAKFSANGQRQWGTYFGGIGDEVCQNIAVTPSGEIYIGGDTDSTDVITSGAFQTTIVTLPPYMYDCLIAKLNTNGQVQWATYYGTMYYENIRDIACDTAGNLYVTGLSEGGGMNTPGTHQQSAGAAFLSKFNPSGQRVWGTYYSDWGPSHTFALVVHPDRLGYVYMGGHTSIATGIATAGTFQDTLTPPLPSSIWKGDAFIVKFNAANGQREWASYYGGISEDAAFGIATNDSGDVYVAGRLQSGEVPSSAGAHQTAFGGDADGFLAKFNSTGQRTWGTYIGGTGHDGIARIGMTATGNIAISAWSGSSAGITTPGSYMPVKSASASAAMLIFSPGGKQLYGTYLHGGSNLACDKSGNIYLAGIVQDTGKATPASHQTAYGGQRDAYLLKFTDSVLSVGDVADQNIRLSLFPNPTSGKFVVKAEASSSATIDVLNIAGQVVYQTSADPKNGKLEKEITLDTKLTNGIYLLRITSGDATQTIRFNLER